MGVGVPQSRPPHPSRGGLRRPIGRQHLTAVDDAGRPQRTGCERPPWRYGNWPRSYSPPGPRTYALPMPSTRRVNPSGTDCVVADCDTTDASGASS